MLVRIEVFLRRVRRAFSRSQWAIRLLRLAQLKRPTGEPGLVMVQIDGLSMTQFKRACAKGHLPFLQCLLAKQRYVLRSFYSGLPSNTPAVQAELFYGIKGAVPAFHFLDRQTGRAVKMLDTAFVEEFQKRLELKGTGLLTGGSAYSDIYTGSAKESHCCWSRMGLEGVLWAINPLIFPLLVVLYLDIFVRTFVLMIVEVFLAVIECIRGTLSGRLFFRELEFVWLRSLVCVFLREFITAGACIDIMRGLPVVHLNFLGYDEQSHGRGPSSGFAHWSLRGIDDAVKRIYQALRSCPFRQYDLWVYSDHGQSKTIPYFVKYGRTLEEAVKDLFGTPVGAEDSLRSRRESTKSRSTLLNRKKTRHSFMTPPSGITTAKGHVLVTAMGPLGHIYFDDPSALGDSHLYARKLVNQLHIPLVLTRQGSKALAWTPKGCFIFPDEAEKVFGAEHPFLEEIKEDLLRVCFHPDAGEFVIAGWSDGQEAVSFPLEYGSHAAMSPEETHGFVLLPMDTTVEVESAKNHLRPIDLRHTAQRFLNRESFASMPAFSASLDGRSSKVTVMSYNVHGCEGMDGCISTDRVARVIARHNPDIIALQELDVGRLRSGRADQAGLIARKLEMEYHFHPAFKWEDEQFGNAILSRYPMALIKSGPLPSIPIRHHWEPRGALWVCVDIGGQKINVINTHLSLSARERLLQTDAILGSGWLKAPSCMGPVVLCGDFNMLPGSVVYHKICRQLRDSQTTVRGHRPKSTWFGYYPISRIDYIFVNAGLSVHANTVPRTDLEKMASDHLPLIVELELAAVEKSQ